MHLDYPFSRHAKFSEKLICDVLRGLVPFEQFKKPEKHPWRSVAFSKVAGKLRKTSQISYPRTHTCVYYGLRNVSFSKNFACVLNGWSQFMEAEGLDKIVSGTTCKHN